MKNLPEGVRFNPHREASMAKGKGKGKGKGGRRKNGRKGSHHKKGSHRRRRNPPNTFGARLGRLAAAGAVAVATGVGVYYAAGKIAPTHPQIASYGVPLAGLLLGVALARKMPVLGAGVAVGSVAPLAVPVATKVLNPAASATSSLGRAARRMAAIDMGAIDMGAVDMRGAHRYAA